MTWASPGPAAAWARTARTPVRTWTPSRSRAARMTSELRGWSVGARRGPDWTIVVATPNLAYTWAGSRPVGPPPRMSRLAGSSRVSVASRFVQTGTDSIPWSGGTLDDEPTATTMFLAPTSWLTSSWRTTTRPGALMLATPR